MTITSATDAVLTLEALDNMPATSAIAKSMCPNVNQSSRNAILAAYDFYTHGIHNDNVIAAILLYKPTRTGIINPAEFKLNDKIIATIDFIRAPDPELRRTSLNILKYHEIPALTFLGITYQNAAYSHIPPDDAELQVVRDIVTYWSEKRPEYACCLQFAQNTILVTW